MKNNELIKIVIADDNVFFGEALRDSLNRKNIQVLALFNTIEDLCYYTSKHDFDILILDINFNGISSLDYLSTIKPQQAFFKILCLTTLNNNYVKNRALEGGVHSFIGKDSIFNDFETILLNCFHDSSSPPPPKPFHKVNINSLTFTQRQLKILDALYEYAGKTESEIADFLCISIYTLKSHKRELFEITDTKNNTDLVKFGIKNGLILP